MLLQNTLLSTEALTTAPLIFSNAPESTPNQRSCASHGAPARRFLTGRPGA